MTMMATHAPLRILVVDDERLIRWSIAETFSNAGHTVVEADSARTAMRELADDPAIDAVVLDYRLPDTEELSLLRSVRTIAPDRPVFLMTAHATPEMTRGAYELGVRAVLHKPFDLRELEARVRDACRRP